MPAIDLLPENTLAPVLRECIELAPMPGLHSGPSSSDCAQRIATVIEQFNLHGSLQEAGLWLLAGELDKSHSVSQAHDSADGSFWHGIMHRREGDYWNAKYWFRRVGTHPVYQALTRQIVGLQGRADLFPFPTKALSRASTFPAAYVDLVEQALSDGQESWLNDLQRIGWWEWQLLFGNTPGFSGFDPRGID